MTEVPQQGPGAEPQWGSGAKPPEVDGVVLNKDTQTLFPARRHHLQVVREFYCTTLNPPGVLGDGSPPAGSRGGAPVGAPKSPEADGILLNKDTETLFPVRRHHLQAVRVLLHNP